MYEVDFNTGLENSVFLVLLLNGEPPAASFGIWGVIIGNA